MIKQALFTIGIIASLIIGSLWFFMNSPMHCEFTGLNYAGVATCQ